MYSCSFVLTNEGGAMLARVLSGAVLGVDAFLVDVEVGIIVM